MCGEREQTTLVVYGEAGPDFHESVSTLCFSVLDDFDISKPIVVGNMAAVLVEVDSTVAEALEELLKKHDLQVAGDHDVRETGEQR